MAAKVEDYALIGDCEPAELVDRNGSVDWKWTTTQNFRDHTLTPFRQRCSRKRV